MGIACDAHGFSNLTRNDASMSNASFSCVFFRTGADTSNAHSLDNFSSNDESDVCAFLKLVAKVQLLELLILDR